MKYVYVLVLFLVATTAVAQESRVDRYFTEFKIADMTITTSGVDGGIGGFATEPVPIFAQAIVKVEEAQRFTWEWAGLSEPGTLSVEGFPSIVFEATSNERREFTDLEVDLNPVGPNLWGSGFITPLQYDNLEFDIHYESFSHISDTKAVFGSRSNLGFGFYTQIHSLDYSTFPESLTAKVVLHGVNREFVNGNSLSSDWDFWRNQSHALINTTDDRVEPFLRVSGQTLARAGGGFGNNNRIVSNINLHHTPTGDADNDGDVDFADFIILANNFGDDGSGEPPAWEDGDFDENGAVDFLDFIGLASNFGQSNVAAVPEPASGLLFTFGLLTLVRLRRLT